MTLSTFENAMTLTDVARTIALNAHGDTRNKHDGELYILHVNRVAVLARGAAKLYGYSEDEVEAVAWLHDVVEDCFPGNHTEAYAAFAQMFAEVDAPSQAVERILGGVRGITKVKGETNEDYYHRCRENEYSRIVKRDADMRDNFSRNHLITDPDTALRMAKKYSLGMSIL